MTTSDSAARSRFAASFVDFENLYYYVTNNFEVDGEPIDAVLSVLRGVRNRFEEEGTSTIITKAYADFDYLRFGSPE